MIGIYKIENLINHKLYIGQTVNFNERVYLHLSELRRNKHPNQHLQNSWNKYGSENFKVDLFEDLTEKVKGCDRKYVDDLLNEREIYWISFYNTTDGDKGFNMSSGGDGLTLWGPKNGMFGRHHTEESKRKMSEHSNNKGPNNARYGVILSEETKRKISEANKGRIQTPEEIEKRRQSNIQAFKRPEIHQKCIEVGIKRRLYTDEFVRQLRKEYEDCGSIKKVVETHNLVYEVCRQAIRGYGRFKEVK